MATVTVGERQLAFREMGSGAPGVLLIHGAGCGAAGFRQLLTLLGRSGHRVVAVDLPGHGASPALEPPPRPADLLEIYADLVAELAERVGLGRYLVAGHSMGGAVALQLALRYGDRLAGQVLIATAARLGVPDALLHTLRRRFDQVPLMLAQLGYSPCTSSQQALSWASAQLQAPQRVALADFLACQCFDARTQLAALDCPTWILSAADDRLTPPRLQEQLAGLIPRARLQGVSRAGHFVHLERPDVVAQTIRDAAGAVA